MSIAGSQFSVFKSPGSVTNGKRSFLDHNGYDIPLSYYYKFAQETADVLIKVPQQLKNQVSGDKQINIRYISIYDNILAREGSVTQQDIMNTRFRISCEKQRNNYNIAGIQNQIIGYLTPDFARKIWQGECQTFDTDSRDDVKIVIELQQNGVLGYHHYTLPNNSFVYMDIEVQYDYNQNS